MNSRKTAHFCSMKITLGVRDFAAQQGVDEQTALQKGMGQKAVEFVKQGASIYRKA
ncbi:MAG: hypothetical protein HYS19_05465 [Nitrosomonadales bacterium]|nr:hypothetical protein [Nitrosomonadales bacterium]